MISFLARFLIPDYKNVASPSVRQRYGVLCGSVGISLNVILFLVKLLAGILSGSIAITADAFNNLSDAGSSLVTLLGFRMSMQAPDPEHPYGHGRIEYISGLFVSTAVLVMAFELAKTSLDKLLHPQEITCSPLILVILAASIFTKLYMFSYNRTIGRKIESGAMKATAIDSFSDALATSTVFLSTVIAAFTGISLDGWCGILVSLFILYSGIQAMRETISPLLGESPNDHFVERVYEIAASSPLILGIHDLTVHDYGPGHVMLSLHAEVPADLDLLSAHEEIDRVERLLQLKMNCTATIHLDPIVTDDEESLHMKEVLAKLLSDLNPHYQFHDFRLVQKERFTNLIFDLVVPFGEKLSDEEIAQQVRREVRKLPGYYFAVITVDRDAI